jgi:PNKP adenylyltransferase domain, C-terminal region/PNKP adenylyltransferase domain, ligase domain
MWGAEVMGRLGGGEQRRHRPPTRSPPTRAAGRRRGTAGRPSARKWPRSARRTAALGFVAKGRRVLTQPAVKCRGREYLRIIYGPEYADAGQIDRLRSRSLGRKRSLAIREFALGIEALERFVRHEPLYRVHECVFGVLAIESEPVDPRL